MRTPLALLLALAALPAAVRSADYQIAVIPKGTTHEYWRSINAGAVKAQRELKAAGTDVAIIWKGPLLEDDREQQIQVVENFISQKVGAIVLAAMHHKDFSATGNKLLYVGVIAAGIGTMIGIFMSEGLLFKLAFVVTYFAVVWICLEAVRIPELRDLIKQGYETTMRITTMVVFILIGSSCFSVVFLGVSGGVWLENMLTSLPGGVWGFLIFINLFIFFLAFFLDFFEIAFIILPMIAPIAQKVLAPVVGPDYALIWFGVMLCVNMQTSFMHPPFGFALFYLRGVAPKEVKSSDIYWGALPWVGLQMIMVVLVIAFPITVTALLDKPSTVDPNKVRIEIPQIELPPLNFDAPKK